MSTYITSAENPFPHVISNISKSDVDCSLKSDLNTMFRDRILCDIKLQTPTETFQAHKNILSARSPVFRAMFTSDMMEKIKDCVDIPDMEADTMHRLLVYVYTNKLEDNQWKNVTDLYEAADKYEIISLKDECSSVLKISLCPANACAILILADLHSDADLKTFVQEYILRNSKAIICSNEWENMIKIMLH
ncbi:TD and POZ domain-containing protein 4 [Caerostris extrusa]|uniref:TD and POZ domain-containing protein 4 n=1 Tax=Caerostris extrusa TaxID=172846 RepID=A0AAV4SGA1_CAEEX|nr:TD and POZ domain-containing protein 4 [Caerostris extrusa]